MKSNIFQHNKVSTEFQEWQSQETRVHGRHCRVCRMSPGILPGADHTARVFLRLPFSESRDKRLRKVVWNLTFRFSLCNFKPAFMKRSDLLSTQQGCCCEVWSDDKIHTRKGLKVSRATCFQPLNTNNDRIMTITYWLYVLGCLHVLSCPLRRRCYAHSIDKEMDLPTAAESAPEQGLSRHWGSNSLLASPPWEVPLSYFLGQRFSNGVQQEF